jgi:hypothetical protein
MAQQKPRCPYCDGLQAENAALRAEVERLSEHADTMAIRAEAAESAAYLDSARAKDRDSERAEHVAAIDCGKPDCTEPDDLCWTHALKAERDENERLSQCLAYERDEYAQYREAHPQRDSTPRWRRAIAALAPKAPEEK